MVPDHNGLPSVPWAAMSIVALPSTAALVPTQGCNAARDASSPRSASVSGASAPIVPAGAAAVVPTWSVASAVPASVDAKLARASSTSSCSVPVTSRVVIPSPRRSDPATGVLATASALATPTA